MIKLGAVGTKPEHEIGEVVGITEKNVSVKLVRLKSKLKKLINEE